MISVGLGSVVIAESIGIGLGGAGLLLLWAIENQYRGRPGNQLALKFEGWQGEFLSADHYQLVGEGVLVNETSTLEIMVPEVSVEVELLSKGSLEGVNWKTRLVPLHPDASSRADEYWFAYIVKVGKQTRFKIHIDITGPNLDRVQTAWIKVNYVTYGPEGRIPKTGHSVYALQYPDASELPPGRDAEGVKVFPIPTHILTDQDDPVSVVERYVLPHAKPGDIVTIGETPIALMQGRLRHPTTVKPGWVAKRICYYFLPTSSLATACGMQTLVDIVGPVRVVFAFVVGALAKALLRKPGVFYQLAGEQARLIDDVTGTLPPFDQFIVLGPDKPEQVVDKIKEKTGLSAAIVDVNDLKAVKILAATPNLSMELLTQALRSNPAGNADEQTPIVLIRPQG
jgi:hypothetical protein